MKTIQDHQLSNQEKTLIAMGAAMGAGCRTCADKLYDMAISLNIPKDEMLKAFLLGLDAKAAAVKTMQEKVALLMAEGDAINTKEFPVNLASLIRMASFTAANSAPDCLVEINQTLSGITLEQVQLCIATAKMVRKNAMGFSDQEIADLFSCAESDVRGACCPGSSSPQSDSGCSCG